MKVVQSDGCIGQALQILAQSLLNLNRQARLLLYLAHKSLFMRLAFLDSAAGQYPKSTEICGVIAIYLLADEDVFSVGNQTQDNIQVFHTTLVEDDEVYAPLDFG